MKPENSRFEFLESRRLRIRRLQPRDEKELLAILSDPAILRYMPERPFTARDIGRMINGCQEEFPSRLAIIVKESEALAGAIMVSSMGGSQRVKELGYVVAPDFQGLGIANEATAAVLAYVFTSLGVEQVEATCHRQNHASRQVLKKLGMRLLPWSLAAVWTRELKYRLTCRDWRELNPALDSATEGNRRSQ